MLCCSSECSRISRRKYFCAWLRICLADLVPTSFSTIFQLRPCRSRALLKRACSSSRQFSRLLPASSFFAFAASGCPSDEIVGLMLLTPLMLPEDRFGDSVGCPLNVAGGHPFLLSASPAPVASAFPVWVASFSSDILIGLSSFWSSRVLHKSREIDIELFMVLSIIFYRGWPQCPSPLPTKFVALLPSHAFSSSSSLSHSPLAATMTTKPTN
mmetsp:Transcript_8424/g.25306  ORF Transcript_8424/g.25306 Transcript_8424/m.25306 type:complete len:213 (-) Transcript_8424:62-700(-)